MAADFYAQVATALAQGPVVVALVTQARGSVPRRPGAALALTAAATWGTIGGGAGEARVLAAAAQVLATGVPQGVEIDLSGAPDRPTQGVCGGWMRVWLSRWQGPEAIALAQTLHRRLRAGQSVSLSLGDGELPRLQPGAERPAPPAPVITLEPAPTLLIVGAGHVAVPLAQVAALAEFRVVVQDERPEFAQAARFPQAAAVWAGPLAEAIAQFAPGPQLYAALVTRGVETDLAALGLLLRRSPPCCYLGAIGSRQRVQVVKRALGAAGMPTARLAQLRAPIGLDLGAETPGEIAVSIVAELIQVRRGGRGQPLSGI